MKNAPFTHPASKKIIETEFRALALEAAAKIGYTLTPEQALALGYELAKTGNGSIDYRVIAPNA